jgi:membrane-bound lytic murein transglycosylase D
LLLPLLTLLATAPARALGQSDHQVSPASVKAIIDSAEASYRQGADAHFLNQSERARKLFDQAVDTILLSGVSIRSDARLAAYYEELIGRIRKHDRLLVDEQVQKAQREQQKHDEDKAERREAVEPALLDELSGIKDTELAAASQAGVKIFGRYDFDFLDYGGGAGTLRPLP